MAIIRWTLARTLAWVGRAGTGGHHLSGGTKLCQKQFPEDRGRQCECSSLYCMRVCTQRA